MIVKVGETKYAVKWWHNAPFNTQCQIWELDSSTVIPRFGGAQCSPKDHYCKETGRKISLAKAIEDFPKKIRQVFWNTYLNRTKVKDNVIVTEI